MKINPYLTFSGNTEKAFNFYRSVFGGEFKEINRYKDMPGSDKMTEEEKNKIMHISLPIGDNIILMGADNSETQGGKLITGNNFQLSIAPSSEKEADSLFKKLSDGGKIIMPLQKTFWNAYFGMLIDQFGIKWLINFEYATK